MVGYWQKVYYIYAGSPAFCFTEIHLKGWISVKYRYIYWGFRGLCP